MSDSPIYAGVGLAFEVERALRARAIAEARRHRDAEEARRRIERARTAVDQLWQELLAVGQAAGALAEITAGRAANPEIVRLRDQVIELQADLATAGDLCQVRALSAGVLRVRDEISRLVARSGAATDGAGRERSEPGSKRRARVLQALADLSDRIAGLEGDDVVLRHEAESLRALAVRAVQIREMIAGDRLGAAEEAIAQAACELDSVIGRADLAQARADRRDYIVWGIVEVLRRMGFVIGAGSPAPEQPEDPASATIIQARQFGGAIAVSVPAEGDIWYCVDGDPMRLETAPDGTSVTVRDEAQAQIQHLHAALDALFGIRAEEPRWEGKPTEQRARQAERLPDLSPGSQRRRET
jgi:hypothetical protein